MPDTLLTKSAALAMVCKLDALGLGFPRTQQGLEAYTEAFMEITGTAERAQWLVGRILKGCSRCPTPIEMRRVFETKYAPNDGLSSNSVDMTALMDGGGKGKIE